jgi:hypothetical protein
MTMVSNCSLRNGKNTTPEGPQGQILPAPHAMAAHVTDRLREFGDIVKLIEEWENRE